MRSFLPGNVPSIGLFGGGRFHYYLFFRGISSGWQAKRVISQFFSQIAYPGYL